VIPCDWAVNGDLILHERRRRGAFPSLRLYSVGNRTTTQFARLGAEARFSPDGKVGAYIGLPLHEIVVREVEASGFLTIALDPSAALGSTGECFVCPFNCQNDGLHLLYYSHGRS
jgi:hypothetical protein